MRRVLCCLVLLFMASPAAAQDRYENTPQGFQRMLESLTQAEPDARGAKLSSAVEQLVIPHPAEWFRRVFGDAEGARLAQEYAAVAASTRADLPKMIARLAEMEGGQITSTRLVSQLVQAQLTKAAYAEMKEPREIYTMWCKPVGAKDAVPFGSFVHVDGTFRMLGIPVVVVADGRKTVRLLPPGAKFDPPRPLNTPAPAYPETARKARTSGVARVRAIVAADGSVRDLVVAGGHPMLVQATLEAIRQWRYAAARLDGNPLEVELLIESVFAKP